MKHIITLCAIILLASCEKHVEPVDLSLKTGNILLDNGQIVPPDYYTALKAENKAGKAIGIVVTASVPIDTENPSNGSFSLIMALDDCQGYYCYSRDSTEIKDVSADANAFNGFANTAALIAAGIEKPELQPEAAYICTEYAAGGIRGWHLPSCAELKTTAKNWTTLEKSLMIAGGQPLKNGWYVSSTACEDKNGNLFYNRFVIMPEGRDVDGLRTQPARVRPYLLVY